MAEETGNVSIGIGLAKLVDSEPICKVNEKLDLILISGGNSSNIKYVNRTTGKIVQINEDSTVTFTEPGIYRLFVLEHGQHDSYDITVSE